MHFKLLPFAVLFAVTSALAQPDSPAPSPFRPRPAGAVAAPPPPSANPAAAGQPRPMPALGGGALALPPAGVSRAAPPVAPPAIAPPATKAGPEIWQENITAVRIGRVNNLQVFRGEGTYLFEGERTYLVKRKLNNSAAEPPSGLALPPSIPYTATPPGGGPSDLPSMVGRPTPYVTPAAPAPGARPGAAGKMPAPAAGAPNFDRPAGAPRPVGARSSQPDHNTDEL